MASKLTELERDLLGHMVAGRKTYRGDGSPIRWVYIGNGAWWRRGSFQYARRRPPRLHPAGREALEKRDE